MNILIPAKSTSRRITRKNLQNLTEDKTLLEWSIDNYRRWFPEAKFYVGTEDIETINIAQSNGCEIYPLIQDDLEEKRNGTDLFHEYLEIVYDRPSILVQCTSPFTFKNEVLRSLNNGKKIGFSAYKAILHELQFLQVLSQYIEPKVILTGNFLTVQEGIPKKEEWGYLEYLIEVNMISSLDINTLEDLEMCRWIAKYIPQQAFDI